MTYKFIISGTLVGLNKYINAERSNRFFAASLKKKTEEVIIKSIKEQLPDLKISKPINIYYKWIEPNKKRDKDNIAFAKKFIQDSLVKSGVIKNDGWNEIGNSIDEYEIDKGNPRIEVILKEIENENI